MNRENIAWLLYTIFVSMILISMFLPFIMGWYFLVFLFGGFTGVISTIYIFKGELKNAI